MSEGRVIRAISGFFDVFDGHTERRCRARGVFRKQGVSVFVGDMVEYEPIGLHEGIVTAVHPRTTKITRPPIANVDHVLVVFSFVTPDINLLMLDKTIVAAHLAGVQPTVVLTKRDLIREAEVADCQSIYERCGYDTFAIAAKLGDRVPDIRQRMQGHISVFAGPSGAGKSTLANALSPGLHLQTGAVSEKIGRGKQTTRHVELFRLDETTWLADAPGFSQLQLDVESRELRNYFPDFVESAARCPYRGCLHIDEGDCAVKVDVSAGRIVRSRYESYQQMYAEIRDREMSMY